MIDPDCRVFIGSNGLLSDPASGLVAQNCDSRRGASGGPLVMYAQNQPVLLGVHVGQLFDSEHYESEPVDGDVFDLHRNVNVSRLVDQHLLDQLVALVLAWRKVPQ